MKQKKVLIASLCALLLILLQSNSIIACEHEEYNTQDQKEEESSSYVPTFLQSGTFLDRLIERYPILDTIIQMILELIQNFLLKINLSS